MGVDEMSVSELIVFLETLAENVELKAADSKEAAEIIRQKIADLRK